jgi:capsular polysaccharide export protein
MIKVLFLAKFGHDFNYFNTIKQYAKTHLPEKVKIDLIFILPVFFVEWFAFLKIMRISAEELQDTLLYEIKRKGIKYGPFKTRFYAVWFTLIARLYYIKYTRILMKGKYDRLGIWGGYGIGQKMAILVAKHLNIKVFHFENGVLPNTTVMDSKGTNYNNSVPRNSSFYKQIAPTFTPKPLIAREGKSPPSNKYVVITKKYIFFPFQVALDTQILVHSHWILSMRQFYSLIENVVDKIKDKDLLFVIKEHPSCNADYSDLHNKNNPRIIFANSNSTQELIENAEMVVTINSSVGIESIIYGKKVITLGNSFYSGYGFAQDVRSEKELIEAINKMEDWVIDYEGSLKFLSYLENIYLIPGSWRNPDVEHLDAILERLIS